jgi:transposase
LIEAAWAYRCKAAIGTTLRRRRQGAPPETIARSWKARRRLHGKYRAMTARGKAAPEAITAIARELADSSGPR